MAIALFTASALFAIQQEEVPMKLVNSRSGFVLVEFKNGAPLFHDRFLEAEMKERGVVIPSNRRAEYEGKEYDLSRGSPIPKGLHRNLRSSRNRLEPLSMAELVLIF